MGIDILLSALAETVLDIAVNTVQVDERLRGWLRKDPARLAFEKDLNQVFNVCEEISRAGKQPV